MALFKNPPPYMNGVATDTERMSSRMADIERSMDEYTRLDHFFSEALASVVENKEMAPIIQQQAMRKLGEEVARLQEKIKEEEQKVSTDIGELLTEHEVMLKHHSQMLHKWTGESAAAYDTLKKAVESPEGPTEEEVQRAQNILKQTTQSVRKHQAAIDADLAMIRNVDLSITKYNTELTNQPLFFLRTCSLNPQDVSLSLGSQTTPGLCVGKTAEIQVKPIKADSSVRKLMTYNIEDDANNVLEYTLKNDIRNRVGGFLIEFTPRTPGKHIVTVELYDQPIKNSPMSFNVEQYAPQEVAGSGSNPVSSAEPPVIDEHLSSLLARGKQRGSAVSSRVVSPTGTLSEIGSSVRRNEEKRQIGFAANPSITANKTSSISQAFPDLAQDYQKQTPAYSPIQGLSGQGEGAMVAGRGRGGHARGGSCAPQASLRLLGRGFSSSNSLDPGDSPNDGSTVSEFGSRNSSMIGRLEELSNEEAPSFQAVQGEEWEKTETAEKKEVPQWIGAQGTVNKQQERATGFGGYTERRDSKREEENWDEEFKMAATQLESTHVTGGACELGGMGGEWRSIVKKEECGVEQSGFNGSMGEERERTDVGASGQYPVTASSSGTESDGIQELPELSPGGETSVLAVTFPNLGRDRPNLVEMYNGNLKKKGIYGRHLLTIGEWDKRTNPLAHLNCPIGCTRDEVSGVWIICDTENNAVKLFNSDGSTKSLLKDNLVKPSAVVMIDRGTLAEQVKPDRIFAVKDDFCIHLFNSSGEFVKKIGENLLRQPRGLALDSTGNLVTLNGAFRAGATTEVIYFDPCTGQLVRRLPFSPLMDAMPSGTGKGPQPRFMDARGDRLVVSDLGLNQVYVTDLTTGAEIGRFGEFGHHPGWFKFVSGVTIDRDLNMVVGDAKSNRVQLFDNEGRFVCVLDLGVDGSVFVSDIHLTSNGLLMVVSRAKHVVKIFKLESRV